ncbi:MAG: hypothetical protein HY299_03460 [Verrucomicrobia bacterium]|nr:hypothetical protein [Verrucomicrobiota bacterium]
MSSAQCFVMFLREHDRPKESRFHVDRQHRRIAQCLILCPLLALCLAPGILTGDEITWTNKAGGNWNVPANWLPSRLPLPGDDVYVTNGGAYTLTLNVDTTVNSLTVGGPAGQQTFFSNGRRLSVGQTLFLGTNGAFRHNGTLTGAVVRVEGRWDWTGGTVSGFSNQSVFVQIAPMARLNMTNNAPRTLQRVAITNTGAITWSSGALLSSLGESLLQNEGLWSVETASATSWTVTGAGTTARVANGLAGTVRKSEAGAATLNASVLNLGLIEIKEGALVLNEGGTNQASIQVAALSALQVKDGTFDHLNSSTLSGAGTNHVSATGRVRFLTGARPDFSNMTVDIAGGRMEFDVGAELAVSALMLRGGTLAGGDTANVQGRFAWTAGVYSNMTVNALGGVLLGSQAGGTLTFTSGRIRNLADGQWVNSTIQSSTPGLSAVLENQALLQLSNQVTWSVTAGLSAILTNAGVLRQRTNTSESKIAATLQNASTGSIQAKDGDLNFTSGGFSAGVMESTGAGSLHFTSGSTPFEMRSGARVIGNGQLLVGGKVRCLAGSALDDASLNMRLLSGTLALDSNTSHNVGQLDLSAGELSGPGRLDALGLTTWQSTILDSNLVMNCRGGLVITGGVHSLTAATLRNSGVAQWTSGLIQTTIGPSAINNAPTGTFTVADASRWTVSGTNTSLFINEGVFSRDSGTRPVHLDVDFENRGDVRLPGFLELRSGTGRYRQITGRTVLVSGGLRTDPAVELDGGTLDGVGEIDATLHNSGTIRPGASPGVLRVRGDWAQTPSGVLEIELAGTGVGQYDVLSVDGRAMAGGGVRALLLGGFSPPADAIVAFLTSVGGVVGLFDRFDAPPGPPWMELLETPNTATLHVLATPPQLTIALGVSAAVSISAEQEFSLPVTLSFPGSDLQTVSLSAALTDPTLVPQANIRFAGTGRSRTMTFRPDLLRSGTATVTVSAGDGDGAAANASFLLQVTPAPPQGLLAWEPFDYPQGASLAGQRGGVGFSAGWLPILGFTTPQGSLALPNARVAGNHASAVSGLSSVSNSRNLSALMGLSGTTRYVSFLARADGAVGLGGQNGYFGLLLQGNRAPDLFIGKPGGGATNRWVIEDAGGAQQAAGDAPVVSGEIRWVVIRLDFADGNDRVALYFNPVAGQPEPGAPNAIRTDRDLGTLSSLGLTSTGAWSVDELRVGTTWESVAPEVNSIAPLAFLPQLPQKATEGAAFIYRALLAEDVTPRIAHFELINPHAGMVINELTGVVLWSPGELDGGQTIDVTVHAHDLPEPPARSAETVFHIAVQEVNQPPQLDSVPATARVAVQGNPFQLQLSATDPDLPANPLLFEKVSGPDALSISPSGAINWTPPIDFPLGPTNVEARVTDFNAAAPAQSQHLSSSRTFTLIVQAPVPDPSVEVTAAPFLVKENEEADFSVVVRNSGTGDAASVDLTLFLSALEDTPRRATLGSVLLSQGSYSLQAGDVVCKLGALPMGATATATFRITFLQSDGETLQWQVTSAIPDPTPGNNSVVRFVRIERVLPSTPANPLEWQVQSAKWAGAHRFVRMASNPAGQPFLVSNTSDETSVCSIWNGLGWAHASTERGFPAAFRILDVDRTYSVQRSGPSWFLRTGYTSPGGCLNGNEYEAPSVTGGYLRDGLFHDPNFVVALVAMANGMIDKFETHLPIVVSPEFRILQNPLWHVRPLRPIDASTHNIDFAECAPISSDELVGRIYDQTADRSEIVFCDSIPPDLNRLVTVMSFSGVRSWPGARVTAAKIHSVNVAAFTDPNGSLWYARATGQGWSAEPVSNLPQGVIETIKLIGDVNDTPTLALGTRLSCGSRPATPLCPDSKIWSIGRRLSSGWSFSEVYRAEITSALTDASADVMDLDVEAFGPEVRLALTTGFPDYDLRLARLAPRWELFRDLAPAVEDTQPRLAQAPDGTVYLASIGGIATGEIGLHMDRFRGSDTGIVHVAAQLAEPFQVTHVSVSDYRGQEATVVSPRVEPPGNWFTRFPDNGAGFLPVGFFDAFDPSQPTYLYKPGTNGIWIGGIGPDHRPRAIQLTDLQTPAAYPENSVSPPAFTPPAAVAFCGVDDGVGSAAMFAVYFKGPPANELRMARFENDAWVADRLLANVGIQSAPFGGQPLLSAHWALHQPFDSAANKGVLYAAYPVLTPAGAVALTIGRLDLGDDLASWQETQPIHQPSFEYGVQSLSLSGFRESVKLAFADELLYILHADRIADWANVANARLETLPVEPPASNVNLNSTEHSTWVAFVRGDRVQAMATGIARDFSGVDSVANQPWLPAVAPEIDTQNVCVASAMWISANLHTDPRETNLFKPYPKPPEPAPSPRLQDVAPLQDNPPTPARRALADPRLGILRHTRDIMLLTAEGQRLEALYRKFSPEARQRMIADPALLFAGVQLFLNYLPGVNDWIEGQGARSIITSGMVDALNNVWLRLANQVSPEFKAVLMSERERFHGFTDFVGKNMDEWAQLLQIVNSSAPKLQITDSSSSEQGFAVTVARLVDLGYSYALFRKTDVEAETWTPVDNATQTITPDKVVLMDPTPPSDHAFYQVRATR